MTATEAVRSARGAGTAGILPAVVADAKHLATNEQLEERGCYPRLSHPDAGTHPYPGQPIHLSATPASFRSDAPALGEHNETLLRDLLGLSAEEYEALIEDGVVCDRPPPPYHPLPDLANEGATEGRFHRPSVISRPMLRRKLAPFATASGLVEDTVTVAVQDDVPTVVPSTITIHIVERDWRGQRQQTKYRRHR